MVLIRTVLAFAFLHCIGFAQDMVGRVEGKVLDAIGEPIVGANVIVTSPALQGKRGTVTDERGQFRFLMLPAGTYTARISHVGSGDRVLEGVRVYLGRSTELGKIQLQQRDLQLPEVVVLTEKRLLDPHTTVTGANLTKEEFEVLPIERNFRSVTTILPHANQSYYGDEVNIAGATGSENRYFINGIDVTDDFRGVTGTNLPYNFIKEIQVKSGGYEPEYRSALGGIINVITQSGGNEFSGQVFGFFTNKSFSSESRVAQNEPPKGTYSQYDFGFGLGGPIVRDNLWFYVAYSPSFRNEDVKLPGLDYYGDEIRAQIFAGKLTWRASETVDVTASVLGDPTTRKGVGKTFWAQPTVISMNNPDPLLSDIMSGGYAVTTEGRLVASSAIMLQGSLSWNARRDRFMPATQRGYDEVYFFDTEQAILSGGFDERVDIKSTSIEGQIKGTFLLGQHTLKAGLSYRETSVDSYNKMFVLYRYSDSSYLSLEANQVGTARNRVPSIYVQDSWSVSDQVTVTGGLRWDGLFLINSRGELSQRALEQFQPRIGATYVPGGNPAHKVFASVGRYAEDILMYGSSIYHISDAYQRGFSYTHDPRVDPTGGQPAFDFRPTPGTENLRGQYFDEVTAGYERLFGDDLKGTVRGIFRKLREIIEDGEDPPGSGNFLYANPGHDPLGSFPLPRRDYLALELSVEKRWGSSWSLLASYVLSRTYGNYIGMYYQETSAAFPNAGPQFDYVDLLVNATGLLANDRTHAFKLVGSYQTPFGLTAGVSFFAASGTPLNEYGASVHGGPNAPAFLVPRGTAGRLPWIWDLNIRLTYDFLHQSSSGLHPRLILDIFHIGSPSEIVQQDQLEYLALDAAGNQTLPNPTYKMPTRFQPPMSMRLGMELNF